MEFFETETFNQVRQLYDSLIEQACARLSIKRTKYLPRYPAVMGILNLTPDSFSDGGQFCT